jgi:hypothetical protein
MTMRRYVAALLGLSLFVTACENGQPEQDVVKVRAANALSDQLKGMSELYRYLGLRRAIMDSGQRCKRVDVGAYQEDYKNMAMWVAHCTDSGDWTIFIAPNGDVQVRKCADAAQLKLPACRTLPPAKPDPMAAGPIPAKAKAR